MTYETKYTASFESRKGLSYEMRLKKRNYSGSSSAIKGGKTPVRISDVSADDKLAPMRGTSMRTSLVIDTAGTEAGFKTDFWRFNDRDWLGELVELQDDQAYQGHGEISSYLAEAIPGTPADGHIEITHIGALAFAPDCLVEFTMFLFPTSGSVTMNFYAVPADQSNQWPDRKLVGQVTVFSTDTQATVMARIALDPNFTAISAEVTQYTQNTYDPDINSGWNVKIEYLEDERKAYWFNNAHRFNGSTQRETLELQMYIFQPSGVPKVISFAKHFFVTGESFVSIVQDLTNQINGTEGYFQIDDVYFPVTGETKLMRIEATANGATLDLLLLEIKAVEGNSIDFLTTSINDTYIRIHESENADYAWSAVDFKNAVEGSDDFKVQVSIGAGWIDVVSVRGYDYDTAETVIIRLLDAFDLLVEYDAYVDPVDSAAFYFTRSVVPGMTYQFITSGASVVQDDGPTFDLIQLVDVIWRGWVLPGLYSQPHQPGYVALSLSAVCGLADLKNATFPSNTQLAYTKVSVLQIIVDVLSQTGFTHDIYEAFDLWEVNMDPSISPLAQMYIDTSRLVDKPSHEVLAEMMLETKSTIWQNKGRWEIAPIDKFALTTWDYRVFNYRGTYKAGYKNNDVQIEVGGETRANTMIDRAGLVTFLPAYKEVIYNQIYGYNSQVLLFPLFVDLNEKLGQEDALNYPWKWELDDVNQTSWLGKIHKDDQYVTIQDAYGQNQELQLVQRVLMADVPNNSDKYQFELQLHIGGQIGNSEAGDTFEFQFTLDDGTTTVYLLEDPIDPDTNFVTSAQTITVDVKEFDQDVLWKRAFNFYNFTGDVVEAIGALKILQKPSTDGFVQIKFARLVINAVIVENDIIKTYYDDTEVDGSSYRENITSKTVRQEKLMGDVPNVPGALQMYRNAIYYFDDEQAPQLTQAWQVEATGTEKRLLDILRQFTLDQYAMPAIQLQANIYGPARLRHIIKDVSDSDQLYMLTSGSWNVRMDQVEGQYVQVDLDSEDGFPVTLVSKNETPAKTQIAINNIKTPVNRETYFQEKVNSFLGSDLDGSNQIDVLHTIERSLLFCIIYKNTAPLALADYTFDSKGTINALTITITGSYNAGDVFDYRIL